MRVQTFTKSDSFCAVHDIWNGVYELRYQRKHLCYFQEIQQRSNWVKVIDCNWLLEKSLSKDNSVNLRSRVTTDELSFIMNALPVCPDSLAAGRSGCTEPSEKRKPIDIVTATTQAEPTENGTLKNTFGKQNNQRQSSRDFFLTQTTKNTQQKRCRDERPGHQYFRTTWPGSCTTG